VSIEWPLPHLHRGSPAFVHRELLLPSPTKFPPAIAPLDWNHGDPFSLEIHREKDGRVRYALGSTHSLALDPLPSYLESTRPRLAAGDLVDCLAKTPVPDGIYARAVPALKHHHSPLTIPRGVDRADHLLRVLASPAIQDQYLVLQLLFRSVGDWERTFFTPLLENVARQQPHIVRRAMNDRGLDEGSARPMTRPRLARGRAAGWGQISRASRTDPGKLTTERRIRD